MIIELLSTICDKTFGFSYENETKYSLYELFLLLKNKINELIESNNTIDDRFESVYDAIDLKEDSTNITINRKLSETGDFTGTWFGDTKDEMDTLIINGQNLYESVISLITTHPEFNIEVIDGSFLANPITPDSEDLGLITEAVTDEIDCGLIYYPCACMAQ